MSILVSQTIDPEELIKQYNWLCIEADYHTNIPELIGLKNLLESIMMRMWGSIIIYEDTLRYQDGGTSMYLVLMPDGTTTYYMQCNEHGTFFACTEGPAEGDLTWTTLDNGDMVPVGFMKEVSIISVEPVIREHVLEYISEGGEYYDQYLEPTT